jgi:hypothetical protein
MQPFCFNQNNLITQSSSGYLYRISLRFYAF